VEPDAQLLVADNGIGEDTARRVVEHGGTVVSMGGNRGFGAAVNRAARRADGDALIVLNDDVTPATGFLEALAEPLEKGATMAAGVLLQRDAPHLIETGGIEIDLTLAAHDYLRGELVDVLADELAPPLAPCGAAAAYRLDAFREVRGFDEGFFAYFEDLDLALRLRATGASCALARRALAVHAGSATLGRASLVKASLVGFSRGYLLRKYGVLNFPVSGALAVAQEGAASLMLAARHQSLAPASARVRGWRTCDVRARRPRREAVTVGVGDAWRRRYSRASSGRP
jgi:GT2 family glycosyltransferase